MESLEIKHILILEPDRTFALRLMRALSRMGDSNVSLVPTLKEACLQLVQNDQDLAFIPVTEGAKIIRSLRAVQPNLRLILVTPSGDEEIPVTDSGNVQGVLIKSLVDVELETLVENVARQPVVPPRRETAVPPDPTRSLDTALLIATLQEARLGRLDVGGVKIAFAAYRTIRSGAKETRVADGFTEDQQFFLGFGQAWCAKFRPEIAALLATVDVHSPAQWRVNGAAGDAGVRGGVRLQGRREDAARADVPGLVAG